MIGSIISMLLVGLVAGVIARFLMPGRDPMGWVATIVLGIVGAFVGGFLGSLLLGKEGHRFDFSVPSVIAAVIGALIVLFIYRMVVGRGSNAL